MEKNDFSESITEDELCSTPRDDGFYMPAEWWSHKQTWLLWPERPDVWRLGGKPAQATFTEVAKAIARFEPVTVGVSAAQFENASARLYSRDNHLHKIRVVEISQDDAWVRDTGPTFVINHQNDVRGVHWGFNAYGRVNDGSDITCALDGQIAQKILQIESCHRYRPKRFVLEGGSIHVDGDGTLITTEECLLNRNRNPQYNVLEIEAFLRAYLTVDKIIWLKEGLYNDDTNGHVDNFCCFVDLATLLLCWTDDINDPNFKRCRSALEILNKATDAKGRKFTIFKLPIPELYPTRKEYAGLDISPRMHFKLGSRLPASYVNFLIVNKGGIVAPSFGDIEKDREALNVMKQAMPHREIVQIYSREIILGLGNIHCITQQQPVGCQRNEDNEEA